MCSSPYELPRSYLHDSRQRTYVHEHRNRVRSSPLGIPAVAPRREGGEQAVSDHAFMVYRRSAERMGTVDKRRATAQAIGSRSGNDAVREAYAQRTRGLGVELGARDSEPSRSERLRGSTPARTMFAPH